MGGWKAMSQTVIDRTIHTLTNVENSDIRSRVSTGPATVAVRLMGGISRREK